MSCSRGEKNDRVESGENGWMKKNRCWIKWAFPVVGLLSLVWFLVRVVPKPTRAAYPCQQVAGPLAGGFLVWIVGTIGSVFAYRRGKQLFLHSRLGKAALCFAIAAVSAVIAIERMPERAAMAIGHGSHGPLGEAKGINPGRVVWVHDADATDWDFPGSDAYYPLWDGEEDTTSGANYGYWWQSSHTDQTVVDKMMSDAVRGLSGRLTDDGAWDAIFRHFNVERGNGDIGYQPGEKITVKMNMVTVNRGQNNVSAADCTQTKWKGWVNTSPQMVLALIDQLVNVVGVAESDITVGDTTCYFPKHYWDHCHPVFPNVNYMASSTSFSQAQGEWGRYPATSSEGLPCETPHYWSDPVRPCHPGEGDPSITKWDYLPKSYAEAAYLINFACLKSHSSGITLCGKNHYGSLIYLPNGEANRYNYHLSLPNPGWSNGVEYYRAMVDMMGHWHLGRKTVLYLIDGLYAGYDWEGRPYRWSTFGNDWPSSLFASQDPVAIDSVGHDFLLAEWPARVTGGVYGAGMLLGGEEDYLHEGAQADDPCSGAFYDPDGDGFGVGGSLGTHEHWNNSTDKQYSRNLGTGDGIELHVPTDRIAGDLDGDDDVDIIDVVRFAEDWLRCTTPGDPDCEQLPGIYLNGDLNEDNEVNLEDFAILAQNS